MANGKLSGSFCSIGSEVEVDLKRLKEKLPEPIIAQLQTDPKGVVTDYKMTDGTGVGLVVEFKSECKYWFFQEEIINPDKENSNLETNSQKEISTRSDKEYQSQILKENLINTLDIKEYALNHKLAYLRKPNSFIKWFLFSIKDIV